jgi:hypothetical protein
MRLSASEKTIASLSLSCANERSNLTLKELGGGLREILIVECRAVIERSKEICEGLLGGLLIRNVFGGLHGLGLRVDLGQDDRIESMWSGMLLAPLAKSGHGFDVLPGGKLQAVPGAEVLV